MKRRVKRLIPTYVIFIIFWSIYQYIIGKFNFQMAIGNILALQNFTGHGRDFNWYISAIFLLYILAPYFKIIAEGATPARKILFTAFLLICSVPFRGATTYIITLTRLPIFFIGMIVAKASKKDKRIGKKEMIILRRLYGRICSAPLLVRFHQGLFVVTRTLLVSLYPHNALFVLYDIVRCDASRKNQNNQADRRFSFAVRRLLV